MNPGPGGVGAAGGGVEDTFESNVELVIYGTMTLYQRHPPRLAAPAPEAAAKQ